MIDEFTARGTLRELRRRYAERVRRELSASGWSADDLADAVDVLL